MATATILRERPRAAFPEVTFDAYGNCLWVLFEDDEYRQWCGIFGAGDLQYEGKVEVLRSDDFMVLVAGRLYRVNSNRRELVFASDERKFTDAIYHHNRDLVIACDWTNLYCFNSQGLQWQSKRISWDGISLDRLDGDCLYGSAADLHDPVQFTLYLDAMHVESTGTTLW